MILPSIQSLAANRLTRTINLAVRGAVWTLRAQWRKGD
jgi:hypothetical protein